MTSNGNIPVNASTPLAPPVRIGLPGNNPLAGTGLRVEYDRQGCATSTTSSGRLCRRGKDFLKKVQSVAGHYGIRVLSEEDGELVLQTRTGMRPPEPDKFVEDQIDKIFG